MTGCCRAQKLASFPLGSEMRKTLTRQATCCCASVIAIFSPVGVMMEKCCLVRDSSWSWSDFLVQLGRFFTTVSLEDFIRHSFLVNVLATRPFLDHHPSLATKTLHESGRRASCSPRAPLHADSKLRITRHRSSFSNICVSFCLYLWLQDPTPHHGQVVPNQSGTAQNGDCQGVLHASTVLIGCVCVRLGEDGARGTTTNIRDDTCTRRDLSVDVAVTHEL